MRRSRTAMALYVALALHLLFGLIMALNPAPQASRGVDVGLSLAGQGLDEIDQALALRAPTEAGERTAGLEWPERQRANRTGGGGDDHYFADLRAHLAGFRRELPRSNQFVSAQVGFTVSADGQVSGLRLVQPSGLDWFDTEALDLIRRAVPLPQPPRGRANSLLVPLELGTRVEGD